MPRPKAVEKRSSLHVILNADLRGRLDRHLEVDGKVPQAAYQRFFEDAIRQHFEWGVMDLGAWLKGMPQGSLVRGPRHIVEALEKFLGGR